MDSTAGAGPLSPTKSSRVRGIRLCNPVHAGLQLLTDVLAHIPGPHQARIQPARHSGSSKTALAAGSAAEAGPPVTVASSSVAPGTGSLRGSHASGALSKEELGRATWTLLHGIAAQYPEQPSRQQKKDVKQLVRMRAARQFALLNCKLRTSGGLSLRAAGLHRVECDTVVVP